MAQNGPLQCLSRTHRALPLPHVGLRLAEIRPMESSIFEFSRNRRALVLAFIYGAILAASFYLSFEVRFDFIVPEQYQQDRLRLLGMAVGIQLVALVAVQQ